MTSTPPVLSLANVEKSYGGCRILRDISLDLRAGDRVLLLGRNGCGKSTLLRICAGLAGPDAGSVAWRRDGGGIPFDFSGHAPLLYAPLTVHENLSLHMALKGASTDLDGYMESWGIREHSRSVFSALSKGLQNRAALARCFLGEPRALLLDEPTTALDHASFEILERRLDGYRGRPDSLVVIATHDIERLLPWSNRLIYIGDGRVSADSGSGGSAGSGREIVELYLRNNR